MANIFSLLLVICMLSFSHAYKINISLEDDPAESESSESYESTLSFIVPFTKWCGPGNRSEDNDALGKFKELDACCRAHDRCPCEILPGETKHGLQNPSIFKSRFSCDCDNAFYDCLKPLEKANQFGEVVFSKLIGFIYFDVIDTKCYKGEYPITCKKYRYILGSCVEYGVDTTQSKKYRWVDVKPWL